jgi:Xaa-Pro aminopeptidase
MGFAQRLPVEFYVEVQQDVRNRLAADGLTAGIFDDPDDVAYLTGFFHFPNERPVAVWLPADADDEVVLLVPELEREYALHQNACGELITYPEFPGIRPPFEVLADGVRPARRVGHSGATTTGRLEALREAFSAVEFVRTRATDDARLIKREPEIALHREAGRVTDLMLEAGRAVVEDALRNGGELPSEADLAGHVTRAGMSTMYAEHDDVVVVPHLAGGLVYSGANSARPHALPSGHRLRAGEVFMLSLGAGVGGRHVEGERTFILGEPTAEQERYYSTVLAAQQTGLAGLRAGRRCADVNADCLAVIREAGLGHLLRHRQGHGIGLNIHEPPWLEDGDGTVLQPNMIVSDEPGLYVPGHGGYRISDSVLVRADGGEPLTFYPKSLDDIVVAA